MEIFPTSDTSHNELLKGYLLEAEGLAVIAESPIFPEILKRFSNYPKYLKDRRKQLSPQKLINKISNSTGVIYAATDSPVLRDIFYTAHVAACCELFNGNNIPISVLHRDTIASWVEKELHAYKTAPTAVLNKLSNKFHSMDAVRTIQILRSLALITRPSATMHQLSLGAGPATKDIRSIHLVPEILQQNLTTPLTLTGNGNQFALKVTEIKPADIIVTDNDPQRDELYKILSEQADVKTLAFNQDTTQALQQLPEILMQNRLPPRNLIVALRIDHRMIHDSEEFLSLTANSMDSTADLIVTMGSGFTLEDFKERTGKINELFNTLLKAGLNPAVIKLHGQGTLEQQRNSPSFGLSGTTTYEILHCKLKKTKLNQL